MRVSSAQSETSMAPHEMQSERQDAPDAPRKACIPLGDKRVPTEVRPPSDLAHMTYAALIADDVDITELRALVLALPDEQWSVDYNRSHNVYMQRPFHDKLGVNSVACIFSDTQLTQVYVLPQYATFQRHLEALFARMNVQPERVVRCLFARMPGETLIPAHHDNGPWVSKTHRIHVPIVTYSNVEFKSGPQTETMTRFAFNEGTIVELNNAAKHSVYNGSKGYRIHLIFDYVDDLYIVEQRMTLRAGQICRQVRGRVELVNAVDEMAEAADKKKAQQMMGAIERQVADAVNAEAAKSIVQAVRHFFIEQINAKAFVRTVKRVLQEQDPSFLAALWVNLYEMFSLVDDLAREELERAVNSPVFVPNWTIIGVQKCGTTSMYEYVSQHPSAMKGSRREPHFFDWMWNAALKHELSVEERATYERVLKAYPELKNTGADSGLGGSSVHDMRIKYLCSLQCANPEQLRTPIQIGESTPSYLLYGLPIAKRMKTLYPDMKLIVMLRDPVKRAYSHYQMTADTSGSPSQLKMRRAVQGKTFEQVVEEDLTRLQEAHVMASARLDGDLANKFQAYADALPQDHGAHSYVGRGLYAMQIALWLRVFPRDQLLIVDLDDMKTSEGTQQEVARVFDFLELDPHKVPDTERKNTRAYEKIDPAMEQRLREFYAPYNEQLFELLGRRFKW